METKYKLNTNCLMYMCKGGHYALVKMLIQSEATVNSQNLLGDTPLSIVCSRLHLAVRYFNCGKLLLKNNANPNTCDKKGIVPLNWCAMHGHVGMTKMLLEAGASQSLPANRDLRPLPMARDNNRKAVAKLLKAAWDKDMEAKEAKEKTHELYLEKKRAMERREREENTPGLSFHDRQRARKVRMAEKRAKEQENKYQTALRLASGDFKEQEKREEKQKKAQQEYELGEQLDTNWKLKKESALCNHWEIHSQTKIEKEKSARPYSLGGQKLKNSMAALVRSSGYLVSRLQTQELVQIYTNTDYCLVPFCTWILTQKAFTTRKNRQALVYVAGVNDDEGYAQSGAGGSVHADTGPVLTKKIMVKSPKKVVFTEGEHATTLPQYGYEQTLEREVRENDRTIASDPKWSMALSSINVNTQATGVHAANCSHVGASSSGGGRGF
jgi:hypothetical protein